MKKSLKIVLITAGVVALLVLAVALLISPVAKHYIEKHSKELVGRTVRMDKFRFNIFNGKLLITKFDLLEASDSADFVTFDTLALRIKLTKLLSETVKVRYIHLAGLDVNLVQDKDRFNFTDIIEHFNRPGDSIAAADTASVPNNWIVELYDIRFRNGRVNYADRVVQSRFDLQDINLVIPGIYFSGQSTNAGVGFDFAGGGHIDTQLDIDIEKQLYDLHVRLSDFGLDNLTPYLKQSMNIAAVEGKLGADVSIRGSSEHVMQLEMQGRIGVSGFSLTNPEGHSLVSADTTLLAVQKIDLTENKFLIDTVLVSGFRTGFELFKDSTNTFTYLMKPAPETPAAAGQPADTAQGPAPELRIKAFDIRNGSISFTDNLPREPFRYQLSRISMAMRDFDPDGVNTAVIRTGLSGSGQAEIKWRGDLKGIANQFLSISVTNMDLRPVTPYALEMFAYPIRKGVLTFTSHNVVRNYNLKSDNKLDISSCEVDNRRKDLKPEYRVPMKTALYIIKDVHDKIKIDLPVSGNVNSPDFSYKKIILKTLVNLLVKVAVSPFNFLAGSLGLSPDKLSGIGFDAVQDELTTEQVEWLNELATVAAAKPELALNIEQRYNPEQALSKMALYNLKRDYYLSTRPYKTAATLDHIDKENIRTVSEKDPAFIAYVGGRDSLSAGQPPVSIAQKLYPRGELEKAVGDFAARRTRLITEYLTETKNIPAANVHVGVAAAETLAAYKGSEKYKAGLGMAGDESENEMQEQLAEETAADSAAVASPTPAAVPDTPLRPDTTQGETPPGI